MAITFMSYYYYYYSALEFKNYPQTCSIVFNSIIQCEHESMFLHMFLDLT